METPQIVQLRAINQADELEHLYLHLDHSVQSHGKQVWLPTELGTGRNAVVLLATTTPHRDSKATDYRAIKFLKDHIDRQYAHSSAGRFFLEASKAKRFHRLQGAFVKYYGSGAIGKPHDLLPYENDRPRDFWWDSIFTLQEILMLLTGNTIFSDQLLDLGDPYDWTAILSQPDIAPLIAADQQNMDELLRLRAHYNLQGPFYVQHLCQGTLHDLLDRKTPWHDLPAYSIPNFKYSIEQQSWRLQKDISAMAKQYLCNYPSQFSGYDILNDFRTNEVANRIRGFAVLELFSQVVYTVAQLHIKQTRDHDHKPLAHRDLKPGNMFIQHDANFEGWNNLSLLLSDLGYVTAPEQIIRGDETLISGLQGHQALGSQFFRAPEQIALPIEVEVDIDLRDPQNADKIQYVTIRSTKIHSIEIHDWLSVSDIFDEHRSIEEDTRLFRILEVEKYGNYFKLQVDTERHAIVTSRTRNLQGHIIRATGFHTDGFSLGAMLYDLISGGRDPQEFYTYCILGQTGHLKEDYTIADLIGVLVEARSNRADLIPNGDLNFAERRRMWLAVAQEADFGHLVEQMYDIADNRTRFQPRDTMRISDRWRIIRRIFAVRNLDEFVVQMIRSREFQEVILTPELQPSPKQVQLKVAYELLTDKRGVPIPCDILRIIVACMVRDRQGSYYRRDPRYGYTSDSSYDAARQIYDDVQELLSQPNYMLPCIGFPRSLQSNLLFKLRSAVSEEAAFTAEAS